MKEIIDNQAQVYGGPWRGFVEDREDPEKSGRIKARIEPLHGKSPENGGSVPTGDLPWAYPMDRQMAPSHLNQEGADNPGSLSVPYEESWVWIWFDRGDPETPMYKSGARPKGVVPDRFKGDSDTADTVANENTVDDKFTEEGPETGQYPDSIGWTLQSGIVVEYDDSDTPRIFRYHPSGWWEQVDSEGNKNEHIPGDQQEVTEGHKQEHVGMDRTSLVEGNEDEEIRGSETRKVEQAVEEIFNATETKEISEESKYTIQAAMTRIASSGIQLQGSGLNLSDILLTILDHIINHTHPTSVGPTGVPINNPDFQSDKSDVNTWTSV